MNELIRVWEAVKDEDYSKARELFREYIASLEFELDFQDYESELASYPGSYAPPDGCVFLVDIDGVTCGCVAMRFFTESVCEMKRLYVRPDYRGKRAGRALAEAVIEKARHCGYKHMRLDTVSSMKEADALYRSLGFKEIEPYRHNPLDGARFFELDLFTLPTSF